jgi:hypothetical protein
MTLAIMQPTSHEDLAAERIALRRRVLDWRDHWSMEADLRLRAVSASRALDLTAQIKSLSYKDLALARTGYGPMPLVAEIVQATQHAAEKLLLEAGAALDAIVAHHLQIETRAAGGTGSGNFDNRDLADLGRTMAPFAVAAGLGLALPGLATTTSVALFGLVTTSTVSVPLLVAGVGGIAALGALGFLSLTDLRVDQERRLNDAIDSDLEARLFAPPTGSREPSLVARLEAGFAGIATGLIGRH